MTGRMFVVDARTKLTPYRPRDRSCADSAIRSATRAYDPESPQLFMLHVVLGEGDIAAIELP